ncbi:MAG TPA: DUF6106 family protein [Clostridiales bacterium]|nr:DUF6106 family protein [Clostridiales bacterium]HOL91983.1 DUF6106 family protein [Clostridiales bacterium]
MDTFMEKLVTRKKTLTDHLITIGAVVGSALLILLALSIPILIQLGLSLVLAAAAAYLGYRVITSRNIEYEYIVTNGDLDIDMIVSKRKRKRIFSANCKEFDIVSPVKSSHFDQSVQSIKNRIDASSSIDSPDAYFITLNYNGERTLVIFEPTEKMLNNFRLYIPRKVFRS